MHIQNSPTALSSDCNCNSSLASYICKKNFDLIMQNTKIISRRVCRITNVGMENEYNFKYI